MYLLAAFLSFTVWIIIELALNKGYLSKAPSLEERWRRGLKACLAIAAALSLFVLCFIILS